MLGRIDETHDGVASGLDRCDGMRADRAERPQCVAESTEHRIRESGAEIDGAGDSG
jgi:hypothetical protein